MLNIGLTSVTFRGLSASEIIKYCCDCGISSIEWGSDVHVPEGDIENALAVKAECDKNGITVSSYGSYYKCGEYEDAEETFKKYVDVAKALGAPTIRIWVGNANYEDATEEYIEAIVAELKTICDMAAKENIEIGCEFHQGSLCNNSAHSLDIVKRVDRGNFGMYFQFDPNDSVDENVNTLKSFLPILKNVHVFNYQQGARYFLNELNGVEMWNEYVRVLKENNISTTLMFEFLKNPTYEGLLEETKILKSIIG